MATSGTHQRPRQEGYQNYQLFLRMLKNTLLQAVQAAASEILRFNDLDIKISNKEGINNLVTEVDHAKTGTEHLR